MWPLPTSCGAKDDTRAAAEGPVLIGARALTARVTPACLAPGHAWPAPARSTSHGLRALCAVPSAHWTTPIRRNASTRPNKAGGPKESTEPKGMTPWSPPPRTPAWRQRTPRDRRARTRSLLHSFVRPPLRQRVVFGIGSACSQRKEKEPPGAGVSGTGGQCSRIPRRWVNSADMRTGSREVAVSRGQHSSQFSLPRDGEGR